MSEKPWYDEDQEVSALVSWLIIIAFSASIAGFGWLVYLSVPDRPRYWYFGQLPDTPADYLYSTDVPRPAEKLQRQIPMLPEAHPPTPVPAERKPQGVRR